VYKGEFEEISKIKIVKEPEIVCEGKIKVVKSKQPWKEA